MIVEIYIARPSAIVGHEVIVVRWSLVPCVCGQHALYAHADTLYCLHWRPAHRTQQIETDDSVAVDMRMDGNRPRRSGTGLEFDKLDFRWLYSIVSNGSTS